MSSLAKLSRWSADHHGVVTLERLLRMDFTRQQVRNLCNSGTLARVQRGLFVVAAVPATELQTVAIACTATGGSARTTTSGRLWALRGVPRVPNVQIAVPYERAVSVAALRGVVMHRSRDLPRTDIVQRRDGIRLTSPPRTLFDLAALVDDHTLESMIEQAIDRGMCGVPTLWGIARRLARPGRAGSARFVDVLSQRPTWLKPVDSHDELMLEKALMAAGLPRPVRQHPLQLPNRKVHIDLAWPAARFAVEVDHVTWHGGRVASAYDKWRDRQVRLLGWEVDRVPDTEIRERLSAMVAELVALYAQRRSGL